MDYKSKGAKPRRQVKEEKAMPSAPLMSPISITGNEVYGVSALQLATGASTDTYTFIAKDIPISVSSILDSSTNLNSLISAPVEELIKAYATARGYVTNTTYANVSEYVYKSLEALSLLMHMFRAQNVSQLKTDTGLDIGTVLGSRPSARVAGGQIPDFIINGVAASANHVNDGAVSISAKDWSQQWLSHLVHLKLSQPLVKWAASMFSVFYQSSGSNSQTTMYSFVPDIITNSSGIAVKTVYDTKIADLAALRNAKPDLVDILNFLGFTNEDIVPLDFTRDLRQLTLPVIVDNNFEAMYVNTNFEGLADSDDDVEDLYFDINGDFNALNYPTDVQLNADVVFAHRYLRDGIFSHTVYKRITQAGSIELNTMYYPFPIGVDSGAYATLTAAQANRMAIVRRQFTMSGLPELPYSPEVSISDLAGVPVFANSGFVGTFVVDAANTYVLPDTFDFYLLAKKAEIIMNNTEYRVKLQQLSNSIRTSSITKQS